MSVDRVVVRSGIGNGIRPNSSVPGWYVTAGSRFRVFFESEQAARRVAALRKADASYEVVSADFESR